MLTERAFSQHRRQSPAGNSFIANNSRGSPPHACQTADLFAGRHRGGAGRGRSRRLGRRTAEDRARRPARGRRQREHASRRAGAGQLRLHAPAKSRGDQPGPGRAAQASRVVRSADHAWAFWPAAGRSNLAPNDCARYAVVGELALDGATRPTRGALSIAMAAARENGLRGMLVPAESAAEAAVVEGIEVIADFEPDAGRGVSSPGRSISSPRRRGSTSCSTRSRTTTSTSPTCAGRRWPSARSPSPPPVRTIC